MREILGLYSKGQHPLTRGKLFQVTTVQSGTISVMEVDKLISANAAVCLKLLACPHTTLKQSKSSLEEEATHVSNSLQIQCLASNEK
jgi:hypothetical protein